MESIVFAGHWHVHIPGSSQRTIILLHGTGGDERSLLPLAQSIDDQANLLSIRGTVEEHGFNRFFVRLDEGVYDLTDLARRTHLLAEFLKLASIHYGIDLDQATLVGYSNGANMGMSLAMEHPGLVKRLIAMRCLFPIEHLLNSPLDLTRESMLLLQGADDPLVSTSQTSALEAFLKNHGAAVQLHRLTAGHQLTTEDAELAKEWLSLYTR